MKTIYILLDNHADHYVHDLLLTNMPWIVKNFSTIMIECVPMQLKGENALEFLFNVVKSYTFDVEPGIFKQEEKAFLSKPYDPNQMTPENFITKRTILLSHLCLHQDKTCDMNPIKIVISNFKRYQFFATCLRQGIQIKGMEPREYRPGLGLFDSDSRDAAIFNSVKIAADTSALGVFVTVGAYHGISLIQQMGRLGGYSCSFVRLATEEQFINKKPGEFCAWREKELLGLKLGFETHVTQLIVSKDLAPETQSQLLQESLQIVQGPALPDDMERDILTGEYLKKASASAAAAFCP